MLNRARTSHLLSTLALAATAVISRPVTLRAQSAQSAPADPVPPHDTLSVTSRILHERRPINVYTPVAYRGSRTKRFPVLYMPDGGIEEDFPHVVNTVDSLIGLGVIPPTIVVGVPNTERRRDLTGPTRFASDSAVAPHVGGSAAFRRFLRDELMPVIDARYRTTRERGIVGESLAGLFIIETFLREPTLFDHYVAFDPSLWWNHASLVDSARAFLRAMPATRSSRHRTLYFAGSRDDIGNGTARLDSALHAAAPKWLTWTYTSRRDLGHGDIFRALAPAGIGSALKDDTWLRRDSTTAARVAGCYVLVDGAWRSEPGIARLVSDARLSPLPRGPIAFELTKDPAPGWSELSRADRSTYYTVRTDSVAWWGRDLFTTWSRLSDSGMSILVSRPEPLAGFALSLSPRGHDLAGEIVAFTDAIHVGKSSQASAPVTARRVPCERR